MQFIEIKELRSAKFKNMIKDVSEEDHFVITELEEFAIDEIGGYLASRYNTNHIFSRTGNERSPLIRRLVIDYVICHLWNRLNSNEIPESLQNKCEANRKLLEDIRDGIYSPNLPTLDPVLQNPIIFKAGGESIFNDVDHIA